MLGFNLDREEDIKELYSYNNYGKLNGLLLARKYRLPCSKNGWLCFSPSEADRLRDFRDEDEIVLCRPDAPMGSGNFLPRGRDLRVNQLPDFCEKIQKICSDAILLVLHHPSVELTGAYLPRYKVSGGVMAVIEQGARIDVEYVGPGFDVGELTRGKTVHTSISIPWRDVGEKPYDLYRWNKIGLVGRRFDLSSNEYFVSRQQRIDELNKNLGEKAQDIEESIPMKSTVISPWLFRKVFRDCVQVIMCSDENDLREMFGVMINIYSTRLYVFEIWKPQRSKK